MSAERRADVITTNHIDKTTTMCIFSERPRKYSAVEYVYCSSFRNEIALLIYFC